ncbi:thioredoxin [archaeon]|nr:thioredoxin [archaeon]
MIPIPLISPENIKKEERHRVLVWFTSPGCTPCRNLEPVMLRLYYHWRKKVDFLRISVDEYSEFAQENDITSVPTLVYYKDGKEVGKLDGIIKAEDIERLLKA